MLVLFIICWVNIKISLIYLILLIELFDVDQKELRCSKPLKVDFRECYIYLTILLELIYLIKILQINRSLPLFLFFFLNNFYFTIIHWILFWLAFFLLTLHQGGKSFTRFRVNTHPQIFEFFNTFIILRSRPTFEIFHFHFKHYESIFRNNLIVFSIWPISRTVWASYKVNFLITFFVLLKINNKSWLHSIFTYKSWTNNFHLCKTSSFL